MAEEKIRIQTLKKMKERGEKISMLTAYDFQFARLLDEAGIEVILVGDSLGNVMLGYENTLPVTMDDMLHHTKAVARGRKRALLVVDMPFMSYQVNPEKALVNASRFLKEGGAEAVKLEGGEEYAETVKKLTTAGIPVMSHIGLMPQAVHRIGGYSVQGKKEEDEKRILKDAKALADAGAFAIVLEKVPTLLAKKVTESVPIPTIGIGAGPYCDGQVLVIYDMLGFDDKFKPRFLKQYANLKKEIIKAVSRFKKEVKEKKFPTKKHGY
ncbi:MAG: 3-methyl-2-oxobutanoate hydroxymethyltransferase [Candidatus Schekmanbacteria bacterium]|nr:MAG: 3-methyl-2-oxobutanoate hydroxymethyltransferase [Candidatus Schekmanbacteria bacterium]